MDERDWLAERFQEHRPRLRAVAYRILGSTSEADDAVQEAWIRLSRSNAGEIDNVEAWLVTVVGRVALNMLRSRKTRREEPLAGQLPDPIVDRTDGIDPEHEALLADSVGLALLVVLETLTHCSTERSLRSGPSRSTTGGSRPWTSSWTPHALPVSTSQS
jgi:RNA polymerase sigma factor (sigma-70 family)